ncbi:MAG: diacylglycerol kinase family lipid kinase [Chloroflexota bacterium]|nr:MAG: diacylglycerol kinase family lipid kinase [Chloroflexota bacterium]
MTVKVILNPYAGRWLALERKEQLESTLKEAKIDYELVVTNGPGHGIDLAKQAVEQGFNPVIAAGGDGTYSEVINGIVAANNNDGSVEFGVIPLGSANDLAENLNLPKEIPAAVGVIVGGYTRKMDLCQVNDRYFGNNAAIGLEPYITLIQQRIKRLKGSFRYLTATLLGVKDKPRWDMSLEWEGGSYEGPVTLVTVGNSPRTGGIFYMTPHADPFDGLLTFVYGFMPTRRRILSLLPRTMKPGEGSYVEHPQIHEVNTPWLKVSSIQPTPAHADGEVFAEQIHDLSYRVFPGCLPILMQEN